MSREQNLAVAQAVSLKPIEDIAARLSLPPEHLELYGRVKAKVGLEALSDAASRPQGKLILVSAITPTPAGEGKTTTTIGLGQALARLGKNAAVAVREPSMGPVFGVKGGGCGGGRSQVLPMEDINLHFTGDIHAVSSAHNLLAAMLDNALFHGQTDCDVRQIRWRRVMDMNDRALRQIVLGLGGRLMGVPREDGFDITAASEIMAILSLSSGPADLLERLSRIVVGFTRRRQPVLARDVQAPNAMAIILKDALKPNLVQTVEGVPAFVHGGPFANIAHGCNSVLATRMALSYADYVVTEAGFGFDLGGEKFLDIKCREAGIWPSAVVLVATAKALKMHGGTPVAEVTKPDLASLKAGMDNLAKHAESIRTYGLQPIIAVNRFAADSPDELQLIVDECQGLGVPATVIDVFGQGGEGGPSPGRGDCRSVSGRPTAAALSVPLGDADRGQDSDRCPEDLRCRRHQPAAPRPDRSQTHRRSRLQPLSGLHGQDPDVAVRRSQALRPAARLHPVGARDSAVGRGGFLRAADRRHADHAGPGRQAGRLGHEDGRDRQDFGHVLVQTPRPGVCPQDAMSNNIWQEKDAV